MRDLFVVSSYDCSPPPAQIWTLRCDCLDTRSLASGARHRKKHASFRLQTVYTRRYRHIDLSQVVTARKPKHVWSRGEGLSAAVELHRDAR